MLGVRRELDRERRGAGEDVGIGVGLELVVVADEEALLLLLAPCGAGGGDEHEGEREQEARRSAPAGEVDAGLESAWPARHVRSAKHRSDPGEASSLASPAWIVVRSVTG